MTAEELQQVKTALLRELPQVLEQDPGFVVFIEGILSEKFPRRDEFARLLDEVQSGRRESSARLGQVDQRLGGVDQRLESVDGRLGGVDQRLESVDGRLGGVVQRLESVDGRLDGVDQRLESVDGRLDGVDQRLESVDGRLDRMDQRFDQIDQHFDKLEAEIRGLRDWMELNVGGFQTRAGRRLEDVVAGAFCYGLERQDIQSHHVKLRQKIVDEQGVVFRPGKTREIDLIALGSEIIVFEVKATADYDDIDDLADKVKLIEHLYPGTEVQGVLVMLGAEVNHRRLCAERGLKLIPDRTASAA